MTSSQVAQLLIVAENNITVTDDGKPVWKKEGAARKYTPPQARTNSGGWTQDGLDRYHEFLRREKADRAKLSATYKNRKEDRPDYLDYPRKDKQKQRKRKNDVEEPRAEDVAIGIDDSDMMMLGDASGSDGEEDKTPAVPV